MAERPARHSFDKSCRVRKSIEYQLITKKGRRFSLPHFVINHAPAASESSRLGLVVSRKVGGAVVRNRIKRVLRDFFRRERGYLNTPLDLVIVARPGCAVMTTVDIFHELRQGLLRASLLCETS